MGMITVSEVSQHESGISFTFTLLYFMLSGFRDLPHDTPRLSRPPKIPILIQQAVALPRYERLDSKYRHWIPWDNSPKDLSANIAIYVSTPPASGSRDDKEILGNLDPGRCGFAFSFSVLILANFLFLFSLVGVLGG
jgi:hypothetical protein